jgi:hypothetical protein
MGKKASVYEGPGVRLPSPHSGVFSCALRADCEWDNGTVSALYLDGQSAINLVAIVSSVGDAAVSTVPLENGRRGC